MWSHEKMEFRFKITYKAHDGRSEGIVNVIKSDNAAHVVLVYINTWSE